VSKKQNVWPATAVQQIQWLKDRLADWTTNADSLGISDDSIAQLTTLVNAANTSLLDAVAARSIAKGKTQTFYSNAEPASAFASAIIKVIRAQAVTSDDPNIYELARLDPPAPPSPVPAPTEPTDLRTTVENDGSIRLSWKARNASPSAGTAFTIFRKLAGQESYVPVGTVGVRTFTDNTVPPGTPSIQYIIRGIRGDKAGPFSEPVTVYLGKASFDGAGGEGLTLAA
jgi:hypothetical protein